MMTRKSFIAASAALAAALPQFAVAQTDVPNLNFDMGAFDAALSRPSAQHRHVFASKRVEEADVFGAMRNTLNAYASLGVLPALVFPVAVLYHTAIGVAFNDDVWNELFIPAIAKLPKDVRDDLGYDLKSGSGNPALHAEKSGTQWDASIERLIADAQAHFFVCNNALVGLSSDLAKIRADEQGAVYDRLAANLIPNAMIVPAGVWAVHAIQERRFTLLQTSL